MPKAGEKKVGPSGWNTCPPSASASNNLRASGSSAAESDKATPLNSGLPLANQSDAVTWVSPIRSVACMTLSFGGCAPSGQPSSSGLSP